MSLVVRCPLSFIRGSTVLWFIVVVYCCWLLLLFIVVVYVISRHVSLIEDSLVSGIESTPALIANHISFLFSTLLGE